MGHKNVQDPGRGAWALARRQHGVITRAQLIEFGYGSEAIKHRIAVGRLHPVWRGVYAVGRPELTRRGRWMAAVLSCGPGALLSHGSAAALWGIGSERREMIEVSVPTTSRRRRPGIVVHRSGRLSEHGTVRDRVPVTNPVRTLVDIASFVPRGQLEAAINEADKRGLTNPEALRSALEGMAWLTGVAPLKETLDKRTFVLTESELERRFLPIVRAVGLPLPRTKQHVNGFKVDFHWPDLGLVVETDGLRYHRTPAEQAADRVRDQAHTAAGLTPLRFTHAQIRFEPAYVRSVLAAVIRRLRETS